MDLVCLCKGVEKDVIVKAIKDGADTFEKVQETTCAGTGFCGASRCGAKIEALIEENK
ncbi:MAG: (2Fe-2S)-binding protein [Clostridium sp.]|uniref:(2Fe-2S)-binding protein n=1 Tax=Clostridium sp. TaxID=1506 RepID=UPI0025BE7D99|nr:(2Fe-2S)-binding protein [Clostridium sp.]MCF0147468.1 (2Fe-2S)-binding protein [Clostridium sp.]